MVACYGIGICFATRFPTRAPTSLHLTFARHGIGIDLVTRFPATAPVTSLYRRARALVFAATPPPWRAHAPALDAISPPQRSRTPAFAATHLLGGLVLRRFLPYTLSVVSHSGAHLHHHSSILTTACSGVCCHTPPQRACASAFAATHILRGLALRRAPAPPILHLGHLTLWHLLPHTSSAGSRSGVFCHTHSRRSCAQTRTCTSDPLTWPPRTPVFAATPPARRVHAPAFDAASPSQRSHALAFAATHILSILRSGRHLHLHCSISAAVCSGVCCHTPSWWARALAFAATPSWWSRTSARTAPALLCLSDRALRHLLPHTFAAGLCSGVCYHTFLVVSHSGTPAPPILCLGGHTLRRLLPFHLSNGCHTGAIQT